MELDDVLNESTPEAPAEPPPAAEPTAEPDKGTEAPPVEKPTSRHREHMAKEWGAQGRDPKTGQFLPKEQDKPAAEAQPPAEPPKAEAAPPAPTPPAQPELTDKERAYLRAAEDERRKRQALEQEVARLRQPAQPGQPQEPAKTFWDDPEGALNRQKQEVAQVVVNARLQTAEQIARARHPDFDEKIAEFSAIVNANPALAHQWLAAPDPAEFAYNIGKNNLLLKQVGSLDALTEKVRQETEAKVRAQVEAEFKAKQEALEKERAALPPSLSNVRGGTSVSAKPQFMGPTPLDDILK